MGYTVAVSEFTDLKDINWEVKIVSTIDPGVLNTPFNLGPDGFTLTYDFDEYDRCKPIVGSRVQITLYHPIPNSAVFDAFYNALDNSDEGTYRIEIYRDQDASNELWWVGEIVPEQTIIPDDYPHAAVTLTAVDGLANLKGIEYKNGGVPYISSSKITTYLHNIFQKMHASSVWGAADIELRFFEDFIGKEYKDYIDGAQNEQLKWAQISNASFYNKDANGDNQFFSCYKVLESLALTFNATVFMAQGSIWWVPLGASQSHATAGIDIANYILGDGTVVYNTTTNVTKSAIFGSSSSQWEKLNGWERTSAPSFSEVLRTRNYQGDKPVVKDGNYSEAQILAAEILSDEDIAYPAGRRFVVSGVLRYASPGNGTSINGDKVARLKLGLRLRIGDAGGSERYLSRPTTYSNTDQSHAQYFEPSQDTLEDEFWYYNAQQDEATWSISPANYEVISGTFNKRVGTDGDQAGALYIGFNFITPEILSAEGLQLSLNSFTGIDRVGADDSSTVNASTMDFVIQNFQVNVYEAATAQEFGSLDITATNPNNSRYQFDQGTTLVGDKITDSDLGTILVVEGASYVDSSEWTSLQSTTSDLSINGLGVRERLAANKTAMRRERGTLFQRGSTYIHPYTILTNTDNGGTFYQVTGLRYIATRCEYDVECMAFLRDEASITIAYDNSKGTPGVLPPVSVPGPDATGAENIILDNSTKLGFVVADTYGITGISTSTGSAKVGINLPVSLSAAGTEIITINAAGAMAPLADGASGEFLKTDGAGALSWDTAGGGGGGWFGSTSLLKVMPTQFFMNDDYTRSPLAVEDDTTDVLGISCPANNVELYAFIPLPTGYKATAVIVYASATVGSTAVTVRQFNQTTGGLNSSTTGDFNASISFVAISSSTTANLVIKLAPASSALVIYGADITIVAV